MRLIHLIGLVGTLTISWAAPLPNPNPMPNPEPNPDPVPQPQRAGHRGGRATTAASAPVVATSAAASAKASTPVAAAETAAGAGAGAGAAGGTAPSAAAPAPSAAGTGTGTDTSTGTGTGTAGSGSSTGHDITVINNCPSGHVELKYGNPATAVTTITGTQHIDGPVVAGIMWLQAYEGIECTADGGGCGIIEFTLGDNDFNSINYSLLGEGLGDHQLQVPMYFEMKGPNCDKKAPGICEGMTAAECASGYTGTDTFSGQPPTCPGNDGVGVTITFCPSG